MELNTLLPLLEAIRGCTFASLDARTVEKGCVREVKGERVMLFSMKEGSGYENKINRALKKLGRDATFRVGALPWGERVENLPLITNRGKYYLQTIQIAPGETRFFIGTMEVDKPSWLDRPAPAQGLPEGQAVLVHAYNIENITGLRLMGEKLP